MVRVGPLLCVLCCCVLVAVMWIADDLLFVLRFVLVCCLFCVCVLACCCLLCVVFWGVLFGLCSVCWLVVGCLV